MDVTSATLSNLATRQRGQPGEDYYSGHYEQVNLSQLKKAVAGFRIKTEAGKKRHVLKNEFTALHLMKESSGILNKLKLKKVATQARHFDVAKEWTYPPQGIDTGGAQRKELDDTFTVISDY